VNGLSSPAPRASRLARYLLAAYILLIVYASLHPFQDWVDPGVDPWAFLTAPVPRWVTRFDVIANLLAYIPLGILIVATLYPRLKGLGAVAIAAVVGASLSIALETLQNYLPTRIPSNLDVMLNLGGAVLGALIGWRFAPAVVGRGRLYSTRYLWFERGRHADVGLLLLAAWLLCQLRPETLLFGNGDLRFLFDAMPVVLYEAAIFVRIEAIVAVANLVSIALLASLLVKEGAPRYRLFLALLLGACVVRTVAFSVLYDMQGGFAWLTPGAGIGLLIGTPLSLAALRLPRSMAVGICGLLLMGATAMVNLAPDNPYLIASLQDWYQGHFLNFNGLTRLVSTLWPFAAMAFLLTLGAIERAER